MLQDNGFLLLSLICCIVVLVKLYYEFLEGKYSVFSPPNFLLLYNSNLL